LRRGRGPFPAAFAAATGPRPAFSDGTPTVLAPYTRRVLFRERTMAIG
jgi:hypothetical protein